MATFDPKSYIAEEKGGGFDPNSYLADNEPKGPSTGAGMAALENFGNAASLGYLPHLQAMASKLVPNPSAGVDQMLQAKGTKIQQPESTYISERDANIRRLQQETQEHPYASAAGAIGGSLAGGAAMSSLTPINAASRIGRIAQAGLGGSLIGALSNPGDTEGQISGLQLDERRGNAAVGAALGAVGQTAVEGLASGAKAVTSLPDSLQNKAEERAFKAAGAMLKDYRQADKAGRINDIGRFMLDNDLVKPGMSVGDIAEGAQKLQSKSGEAIGDAYERAFTALKGKDVPLANLNPKQLAKEFLEEYGGAQAGTAGGGARLRSVQSVVDDLAKLPDNSGLSSVNKFRQGLDDFLYANNKSPATLPETKQGLQAFRSWLDQRVDGAISAVDRATGGKISQELPELNRQYGLASEISRIAGDQSLRQNANRFLSPTDYLSGATGAIIGAASGDTVEDKLKHAALGASVGLVNKAGRTYGTPLVSLALDKAGSLLARTPLASIGEAAAPVLNAAERSPIALSTSEGIMSKPNFTPSPIRKIASEQPQGEDRWARQGVQKLGIQDQELAGKLLQDPKAKQLLIQASDLKPGSKAMKNIMNQIQKGWSNP